MSVRLFVSVSPSFCRRLLPVAIIIHALLLLFNDSRGFQHCYLLLVFVCVFPAFFCCDFAAPPRVYISSPHADMMRWRRLQPQQQQPTTAAAATTTTTTTTTITTTTIALAVINK